MTSPKDEIRNEAARILESATYASETQFEYAKRWRRVDRWIGSAAAVLAAVAGVGGLSQVLSARWAGLIAVLAAGTGAVSASISAPQTKEKAAVSATAYRALQQDARIFLTVDLSTLSDEDAREIAATRRPPAATQPKRRRSVVRCVEAGEEFRRTGSAALRG